MQVNNKAILLSLWAEKMSSKQLAAISTLLDNVGDEKLEALKLLKLKSPSLTLVFSFFLGGLAVDRFYLGDTGLGILKILSWLGSLKILFDLGILQILFDLGSSTLLFVLFGFMIFGIWYVFDWFLTWEKAEETNFSKTMQMIMLVS